jgi:hypothetical protein
VAEKRKLSRFRAPFYIKYGPSGSLQRSLGLGKDINFSGVKMLLENTYDVNSGNILDFDLLFPDKEVKVSGVVAWTQDYGDRQEAGVYFTNLREGDQSQAIYEYIYKYFPQELTRRWWTA